MADLSKPQWSLLPWEQVESVVKVMTKGVEKYPRDGWKKCSIDTHFDKAMRHILEYKKGIRADHESGQHPLAHAVCRLLFLMELDN